jgi:hypothetical protein
MPAPSVQSRKNCLASKFNKEKEARFVPKPVFPQKCNFKTESPLAQSARGPLFS